MECFWESRFKAGVVLLGLFMGGCVVAALPEDIATRVRAVQAVSPDDIRLQLGNDAIVRWGNASEPEFKAEVLAALMTRRARGYDVSAPELPTTFNERGPKK